MIYLDEIIKEQIDATGHKLILDCICTQCPYAVWQEREDGNLDCLCPKLKIMSYSVTSKKITKCSLQKVAIAEYQERQNANE